MRRLRRGAVLVALVLGTCISVGQADELADVPFGDVAEYLSDVEAGQANEAEAEPFDISTGVLPEVVPAQMLAPQRSLRVAQADRSRRAAAAAATGLASVPFMIGDTGAGTCFAFTGLLDMEISHPTLACSRLNISENNTPLPTDRLYFSYRHFHNSSNLRYLQFTDSFDVDRYTLGGERTFFNEMMSFELRLPLENRISSERFTYDVADPPIFFPGSLLPAFLPFGGGTRGELGNISLMVKALLHETPSCAISAGVGVTLPTAQDVVYLVTQDTTLVFPSAPGFTAETFSVLDVYGANETVYVAPYLAWLTQQPGSRFFHQGFLQVEVAANPTSIAVAGQGLTAFYDPNGAFVGFDDWVTPFPTGGAQLFAQTLMRLNLGFGYNMIENPRADLMQQLTGMLEVHYTSTLNDAIISSVPLINTVTGTTPLQTIEFGNLLNRVDIVNVVLGLSARCGNWVFTNGCTAPVSSAEDKRGFDFEYNFQAQRIF